MKPHDNLLSGSKLAKNTIYNLLGLGAPVVIAIFLIPVLIKGLGTERFGILNIGWVVIGYFSLFDFGIGRALTKIVSEKLGQRKEEDIPDIFWTSIFIMFVVSTIGSVIVILLTPTLVEDILAISPELFDESYAVFYTLAAAIPIVTTTAGLRGVLESYQQFGIISIIRTALGAFTFIGPALVLLFTNDLFWVILIIVFFRVLIWALFLYYCFKVNSALRSRIRIIKSSIKPLIAFGSWITVSNFISPIITYIDRFLIGAVLSVTAVTYYSTPFEVVTRFLIIPGAIIGVLFPAFSASYFENKEFTKKLFFKGSKYIYIIIFPLSLFFVIFANDILSLWLGNEFAQRSTLVFQFLTVGVLFNGLAYIPFTFLQGIGKPDVTAKLHLIEIPVYTIILFLLVKSYGINGAAFAWFIRAAADAVILFFISFKVLLSEKRKQLYSSYIIIASLLVIMACFFVNPFLYKLILFIIISVLFFVLTWVYLLDRDEKSFIFLKNSLLKPKNY